MELISIIFYKLLYMSIVASIIGISIIAIRKLLSRYISPKIIYAMWIVFLLALVVPPFISSKVSVYNYIDVSGIEKLTYNYELTYSKETFSEDNKSNGDEPVEEKTVDNKTSGRTSQETKPLPSLKDILPALWLTGAGTLMIIYVISNLIFIRKIGSEKFEDDRIIKIFETAKTKFKLERKIELINQTVVKSPAIVGIVKPKIFLTEEIKKSTDTEVEYIFRHELAHFKRKDNVINSILIFLRTIHWFNPIVWLVMKEIKKDMEFTADEKAVKGLEIDNRKEYCKLLVNLSSTSSSSFMERAIGIANDKNNLEKRINMIKLSDKLSKHPVFSAMLVFIIIGLICLILYTNNYYQPNLDVPPKLYIKTATGQTKELLLTYYEWLDEQGGLNYFNIGFDANTYKFKDENTVHLIVDNKDYETAKYTLYTEPKYKFAYINNHSYSKRSASGENDLEKYAEYRNLYPQINDIKYESSNSFNDIESYDVYFANGSVATYAMKVEDYYFCRKEIFDIYANTDIGDKDKIEKLVKEMILAEFLVDLRVENNVLYLNYEYVQSPTYAYDMATVLFVNIPKLEKVVFTANHKKVKTYSNEQYDASVPLEITRDSADENAEVTIEALQKIVKES